jgi:hypothetical protein
LKNLHPACRVRSGVEVQKGQNIARVSKFVLGAACSSPTSLAIIKREF